MKTHENGMFIALKYGAAVMAAAALYRSYVKQNGGPDPKLLALADAAMKQRAMDAYHRSLRMPRI